jgi:hypothetical protein
VKKENIPRSEHVIIPADNISSRCTCCGGTIFTGGADTEQSKIANTPRRNSETNSFHNKGAKFGSRINLNEKDSIEAVPPHNNIIIQFNSCLFTWKLNSPEANYRVSTSKRKKQQSNTNKIKTRQYTYNNNNNNSLLLLCRVNSKRQLQKQHSMY